MRAGDAADSAADPDIRPYSLAVSEKLDRVVTSSSDMMGAPPSHVVQVWRLSDLELLATIPLPKPGGTGAVSAGDATDASEPRLLADGETVVVPTFNCGLFLMRNLGGDRLVITGFGAPNTCVKFATIDREIGRIALSPESKDFTRDWPDGWKGSAIPHGAVFGRE